MTDKAKLVLKGLLELSEKERSEVITESTRYEQRTFSEQKYVNESFEKAQKTLGPISEFSCPCCGR